MGDNSDIEWTDATWNPVRGCVKVSPGCKHCYAETFAERWRGISGHAYERGFEPRLVPEKLDEPLRWTRPRTIFVNSMSDLFGDFVPDAYIDQVLARMLLAYRHTYQVLTKRAERLPRYLGSPDLYERVLHETHALRRARPDLYGIAVSDPATHPAPWIWIGVSVEDRRFGVPRIDDLRRTPAAVRFLSIEPLLEDLGTIDLTGIGWVILGGESGPGARQMDPAWARSVRDQCIDARVPFFFKQWGGVLKKKHGRSLDDRTWNEMPMRAA